MGAYCYFIFISEPVMLKTTLDELKEASLSSGLDEAQRNRILDYLWKSNPMHPLVVPLRNALSEMSSSAVSAL